MRLLMAVSPPPAPAWGAGRLVEFDEEETTELEAETIRAAWVWVSRAAASEEGAAAAPRSDARSLALVVMMIDWSASWG
jgi:hypothetical protein